MAGGGTRWAAVLVSAGALAAGGVTAAGQAPVAAAVRPDAGGWRIALRVSGPNAPYFSAVTATGPASGWAFEGFQFGGTDRAAAWQLTGRGWHRAAFPGRPGELVTWAAASSPGNVWAIAQDFPGPVTRVLHWDGATLVGGPPVPPRGGRAGRAWPPQRLGVRVRLRRPFAGRPALERAPLDRAAVRARPDRRQRPRRG